MAAGDLPTTVPLDPDVAVDVVEAPGAAADRSGLMGETSKDGRLAEIFFNAEKIGTTIETQARDSAIVASIALQQGANPETLRHALTRNRDGSASGPLGELLDLVAARAAKHD